MFNDPYARKRLAAQAARQRKLIKVVSQDLPVDGDPAETRRPTQPLGGLLDSVMESLDHDLHRDESLFLDRLRERWDEMFPNCPARPGRLREGRLVLNVATSGQMFAMRPRLPAMKRKIKEVEGAPKGRLTLLLQIGQG